MTCPAPASPSREDHSKTNVQGTNEKEEAPGNAGSYHRRDNVWVRGPDLVVHGKNKDPPNSLLPVGFPATYPGTSLTPPVVSHCPTLLLSWGCSHLCPPTFAPNHTGGEWRLKYERAVREVDFTKKRLQQEFEDKLEVEQQSKRQLERRVRQWAVPGPVPGRDHVLPSCLAGGRQML